MFLLAFWMKIYLKSNYNYIKIMPKIKLNITNMRLYLLI